MADTENPISSLSLLESQRLADVLKRYIIAPPASNYGAHLEVLHSFPKRRRRAQRPAAQLIANIVFPCTSIKAIIEYQRTIITLINLCVNQIKLNARPPVPRRQILDVAWDPIADPVSLEGPKSTPMPVQIGPAEEFSDVFSFLREGAEPLEFTTGVRSVSEAPWGITVGEEQHHGTPLVEFSRGIVYVDGRLDLCKKVVGPDHIEELIDSLENNTVIRHFLLGNNVITNLGARRIAKFVRDHPDRMETWYLAGNHIKIDGFKALVQALEGSPALTNLWLKRNPLGPEAGQMLGRLITVSPHLRTLDVECCELGDEGVASLFDTLIERSRGQSLPLEMIYINANGIGAHACSSIARYLEQPMCDLQNIFMSANPIGDDGARVLAAGLERNTSLLRITLSSCGLTSTGVTLIARALSHHPRLISVTFAAAVTTQDLDQRRNHITDSETDGGADLLSALKALIDVSTLRHLELGRTALSYDGLAALEDHVKSSTNLCLFACRRVRSPVASLEPPATCSLALHNQLATNTQVHFGVILSEYNTWKAMLGGSRYVRNAKDVRLIDSMYRTRDKANGLTEEDKRWKDRDELWAKLDEIP